MVMMLWWTIIVRFFPGGPLAPPFGASGPSDVWKQSELCWITLIVSIVCKIVIKRIHLRSAVVLVKGCIPLFHF